jgi:hypothetical protein
LCLRLLPNQDDAGARRVFVRLFRQHGLPAIIGVDNGSPFASTGALGLSRLSGGGCGWEFVSSARGAPGPATTRDTNSFMAVIHGKSSPPATPTAPRRRPARIAGWRNTTPIAPTKRWDSAPPPRAIGGAAAPIPLPCRHCIIRRPGSSGAGATGDTSNGGDVGGLWAAPWWGNPSDSNPSAPNPGKCIWAANSLANFTPPVAAGCVRPVGNAIKA